MTTSTTTPLQDYIRNLHNVEIADKRLEKVTTIGTALAAKLAEHKKIQLVWVCNHNSRRSQMAEAWSLAFMGQHEGLTIASAGETRTEPHPSAIKALAESGFKLRSDGHLHLISTGKSSTMLRSKTLAQLPSHAHRFVISVCTNTDADCPYVPGAVAQYSLPFDDPKFADDTPAEAAAYAKACREIARSVQVLSESLVPVK